MRDSRTLHCPPLLQFWIVAEATPGQVLPVSTTKRSQKEVSLLELSKSKSTVQREVGCWCFQKLASCTWKESYTLLQPGSVFKVCKGLKKRFEDLHSLSLNFCLTKFVRTIERAFVQVSHSFANWYLPLLNIHTHLIYLISSKREYWNTVKIKVAKIHYRRKG